jgi:hypothetical protein
MKEINAWPVCSAKLVSNMNEIPKPNKLLGSLEGYSFYKTRHGEYAIKYKYYLA